MTSLRGAWAAFRLQLQVIAGNPDYFIAVATAPLLTVVFVSIVRNAGRDDLIGFALIAPVLITLWRMSTTVSGEIIDQDRSLGVLEPTIATPSSLSSIVLGRVSAVSAVGLVGVFEAWLVAGVVFGVAVTVEHPLVLLATLAAATFAMSGTAVVMAAVFASGRGSRIYQQTLTFPFYVLGGVLVPVSFLPFWLRPVSRLVFLSWSADLLRASLTTGPVDDLGLRLGMVVALGFLGFAVGGMMLRRMVDRARSLGTMNCA